MHIIKNIIIGSDENLDRRNVVWNIWGSFLFAFASMLLTVVTTRITGKHNGGVFAFGLSSLGQQMLNISYLGIRPFHVTDTQKKYSFGDYFYLRIAGCIFALVCSLVYGLFRGGYTQEELIVIFLAVLFKVIDGFADVYECEFQRSGRLYLAGKSNAFRTLFSVSVYLAVLLWTKNLLIACLAINIAAVLGVFVFNIGVLRQLLAIDFSATKTHMKALMFSCMSLFIGGFMELYIFTASRYAVETQYSKEIFMYYTAIFMPTSVINLVATFVIRPYLTELSYKWGLKDYDRFRKRILQICAMIAGLGVVAVIGAWLLGTQVLGAIYGLKLSPYRVGLIYIIIGGSFNAATTMLYYALVIMGRKRQVLYAYIIGFILALLICPPFAENLGLNGAGLAHMILMCTLTLLFALFTLQAYFKEVKRVNC